MLKWLLKDKRMKFVSVVLAVTLWFFVNSPKPREVVFTMPVQIFGIPQNYIVKKINPSKIKVKVRGKFISVFVYSFKAPKIKIQWNSLNTFPGISECSFDINAKNIEQELGIEIVKIETEKGNYEFERTNR